MADSGDRLCRGREELFFLDSKGGFDGGKKKGGSRSGLAENWSSFVERGTKLLQGKL